MSSELVDFFEKLGVGIGNAIGKTNLALGSKLVGEGELIESSDFDFFIDEVVSKFFWLDFDLIDFFLRPVEELAVIGFYTRIRLESLAISMKNILFHIAT